MCFLVALSITKNRALEKKITYMAKIEFSKLNLSRTLMKTKGKRNLKGKQNCIYLLYFAMQNDWFLPHILIILVYLQYGHSVSSRLELL